MRTEDGDGIASIESRVLDLIGDISALLDLTEFRDALLAALRVALPCDYISLNQVAHEPEGNWSIVEPPLPAIDHDTFYRLALQNPLADRYLRTHDGRPHRLSDIVTPEQFHATDLYRHLYGQLLIEYQIAFTLPSASEPILAIALSRCEQDFTDTERELLTLARPHLIQAYRNALEFTDQRIPPTPAEDGPDERTLQALGLTPAQARVLRRVAIGRSSPDIASELQIAQRTVEKHLQRSYEKLGVKDRSSAARKAWQTTSLDTNQPPVIEP